MFSSFDIFQSYFFDVFSEKDSAFQLHMNIFDNDLKEDVREKNIILFGHNINIKQMVDNKKLPTLNTLDLFYSLIAATSCQRLKTNNHNDLLDSIPVYNLETNWRSLCTVMNIENSEKNRKRISENLIDLNTVVVTAQKSSLNLGFPYLSAYSIGLKSDDSILLNFPLLEFFLKRLFTLPIFDYLSLSNDMSKTIFILVYCLSKTEKNTFEPNNITMQALFNKIGKNAKFLDNKSFKYDTNYVFLGLLELHQKGFLKIMVDKQTIDSLNTKNKDNLTLATVISFSNGEHSFSQSISDLLEIDLSKQILIH